jgi:hypothetical protein
VSTHLLAVVVGIPLAWHVGLAAYAYFDAGRNGMNPGKWATIALLVPLFGFFAYIFERGEQDYDPAEDPYAGGGFNVHESREGDVAHESRVGDESIDVGETERRPAETGDRGSGE